jgi:hypothetical protein
MTLGEIDVLPAEVAEFIRTEACVEHDRDNILQVTRVRIILDGGYKCGTLVLREMPRARATRRRASSSEGEGHVVVLGGMYSWTELFLLPN